MHKVIKSPKQQNIIRYQDISYGTVFESTHWDCRDTVYYKIDGDCFLAFNKTIQVRFLCSISSAKEEFLNHSLFLSDYEINLKN